MEVNAIIEALTSLRNDWQSKADTLTGTIELLMANLQSSPAIMSKQPVQPGHILASVGRIDGLKNQVNGKTYKEDWNKDTIDGRILTIIQSANRFLSRNEIEEWAKSQGNPFPNPVASQLSSIKKSGKYGLILYKVAHNNVVWGFEKWLDLFGKIIPEHMYKTQLEHSV